MPAHWEPFPMYTNTGPTTFSKAVPVATWSDSISCSDNDHWSSFTARVSAESAKIIARCLCQSRRNRLLYAISYSDTDCPFFSQSAHWRAADFNAAGVLPEINTGNATEWSALSRGCVGFSELSRMTWALVPPKPKELTPTISLPTGFSGRFSVTTSRLSARKGICGL